MFSTAIVRTILIGWLPFDVLSFNKHFTVVMRYFEMVGVKDSFCGMHNFLIHFLIDLHYMQKLYTYAHTERVDMHISLLKVSPAGCV